ncbi:eukaryotic protein [Schizosaccharomyces japonicus yFS275]|uniref:Eukaryotic protein n=1 Tax=Schizosaccharomyces japonicus (strain yFS275 / FY16936) TaxID=402676 RepID=B6K0E0_SCHJY|nr:eukaryotic protein [Schizosaccharomyces japonicus yFS275]EEB06290.1 eukaryotic protein [Schizosaccharomyces japonicus yFS275]
MGKSKGKTVDAGEIFDISDLLSESGFSVDTNFSTEGSVTSELPSSASAKVQTSDIQDAIDKLSEYRSLNAEQKKELLRDSLRICSHKLVHDSVEAITSAVLSILKQGRSKEEIIYCCKLLNIISVYSSADIGELWSFAEDVLVRHVNESSSTEVVCACLMSYTLLTLLLDTEDDSVFVLEFLQGIIDSDGAVVCAEDVAVVVQSACFCCGLLITTITSALETLQEVVETLQEQLSSSEPGVQIAAAESIAMAYEKYGNMLDLTERASNPLVRRKDALIRVLVEVTRESSKTISKGHKKQLHKTAREALVTVESDGADCSLKEKIKLAGKVVIVDSWEKLFHLQRYRYIFGSGLGLYFSGFSFVRQSLGAKTTSASLLTDDVDEFDTPIEHQSIDQFDRRTLERTRDKRRREEQRLKKAFMTSEDY